MNTKSDKGTGNPLKKKPVPVVHPSLPVNNRFIEEKELSDLIINCLPGIFYLQDHTGKYLRWNNNFEIATGYGRDEIERMHPLDFFDLVDHEHMKKATRKVYDDG